MRQVIFVPVHAIIVSLMRHRRLLLFTLTRRILYCTLSASATREIDSSVIGRYRERARENESVEQGRQNNVEKDKKSEEYKRKNGKIRAE